MCFLPWSYIFFCFSPRFLCCSNHVQNTTLKVFHFRNEPIGLIFYNTKSRFCKTKIFRRHQRSDTELLLKPLSANPTKWSNTQTLLFEFVWAFCGVATWRVKVASFRLLLRWESFFTLPLLGMLRMQVHNFTNYVLSKCL